MYWFDWFQGDIASNKQENVYLLDKLINYKNSHQKLKYLFRLIPAPGVTRHYT